MGRAVEKRQVGVFSSGESAGHPYRDGGKVVATPRAWSSGKVRLEAKAQQLRLQNLPLLQAGLSKPLSVDFWKDWLGGQGTGC